MIASLTVKNLAVVKHLDLTFEQGMSVITGETGAGKSILLQALGLVLGVRGDASLVRHGKDKAEVSAVFAVEHNKIIQNFLQKQSLNDEGECVLRRVIRANGKSKAFINGNNATLSLIRELGDLLIDMHGQNEQQLLLRPGQQLMLLDGYAQLEQDKSALNLIVDEYKTLTTNIANLGSNQAIILQQQALYTHQLAELTQAQLTQDELNNIESDFKISTNAQALIETASSVLNQLKNDTGTNAQLRNLNHELSQALAMDDKLSNGSELLNSAQLQTQEAIYELTHYLNNLSIDEESASNLEARISELHDLGRKHDCQIIDLLDVQAKIAQKLSEISIGTSSIDALSTRLTQLEKQYYQQAQTLSDARISKAKTLSKLVSEVMQTLGMPGGEFAVALSKKPQGVHLNGIDAVEFLVKTNRGQDFSVLKKIASGGELSRISLAISVISSDAQPTPTLIFDEVDVGISGAVAEVVGRQLQKLSTPYQIICITHLAQVAAFAHQHLRVSKSQHENGAQSRIEILSADQRIEEIARILGGTTITEKTRKAAEEMIKIST